ncbi:hypothetical protein CLOSBL3_40014 [Clostridiaceae bacterium BL-3]|nr:hypothetical protein CLOSBL3_40014 [Clostridiaceae bacterium BL-3]
MIENLGSSDILSKILNILSVILPILIVLILIIIDKNNN